MRIRAFSCLVAPTAAVALFAGTAKADLNATAQVALTSSTAGNNKYTITVTNTGSSDIGTFWFAWTPPPPAFPVEYDFLPAAPSTSTEPSGWIGFNVSGVPGTSIEFYNISGSNIASGQQGTFTFTTTDSLTALQGSYLGLPITTSFIYAGFPEEGATTRVTPTVVAAPEPASLGMIGIAALALLRRRRG